MATSLTTESDIASNPECDTLGRFASRAEARAYQPQGVKVWGRVLTFPSRIVIPSAARDPLPVSAHGFSRAEQVSKMRGALALEVPV